MKTAVAGRREVLVESDVLQKETFAANTAVVKRIRSWRLDVEIAGSDPSTAGQIPHLTALCWSRIPSWKNDVHCNFTTKESEL